jgi:hypothetical protein
MPNMSQYWLSPEGCWATLLLLFRLLISWNILPSKVGEGVILSSWAWVPLFALATLGCYFFPFAIKKMFLTRAFFAGVICGHFLLDMLTSAYPDQGPGIGTTYLVGIIFILAALLVGCLAMSFFWR